MTHYDNEPEQGMHGAEAVAHFLDRKHASYELIEHVRSEGRGNRSRESCSSHGQDRGAA